MPPWRNWQTRRIQNPMAVKAVSVRSRLVVLLPLKNVLQGIFLFYYNERIILAI